MFFLIIYQLLYLAISYISETELFIIPHMVCTQIQVFETIIRGILDTTVATGFLHSGSYETIVIHHIGFFRSPFVLKVGYRRFGILFA